MILLALACVTSPATTQLTGRLEPTWWYLEPGYGELPNDALNVAYVLRVDPPADGLTSVIYLPGGPDDLLPDAPAAACPGGRAVVEGRLEREPWPGAEGALTHARVVSCERPPEPAPRFGETVALTGTLRRWWWFTEPGYGATPAVDVPRFGAVLLVDGTPVPIFGRDDAASVEQERRLRAACDGQAITVTGRWEPASNPRSANRVKLMDATFDGPCAQPKLDRPVELGPKPVSPDWLMEPISAGGG